MNDRRNIYEASNQGTEAQESLHAVPNRYIVRKQGTLRLQVLHKDGVNETLSFFPLQFKIEVVCAVDPKTMLDPILLGWKKQRINSCQNVPSQQATTPSTA